MGRKKIPKSEKKIQLWVQVKKKHIKEGKEKVKELQTYFDLIGYEGVQNTDQNPSGSRERRLDGSEIDSDYDERYSGPDAD